MVSKEKAVRLEIVAHTFQGLGICTSCELVLAQAGAGEHPTERALDEYPWEWQQEVRRLTDWVYDLAGRYGDQIQIRVIDPQSPEGLLKSLRYRVRRYPTFVVEGKARIIGWQREQLEAALVSALASRVG